ncbi:MAG TPA: 2OG-Fe(II) oxygenase family protein [Alphaproteobacteria bacterium]|nr:2OG-Fe(II) oxygenase family protein [Alphaproteobacteria bacterium]
MKHQLPIADILSENFTADFHRNSEEIGFNAVANASTDPRFSIDGKTIEEQKILLYKDLREFADLPESEKEKIDRWAEGQRGYTGLWVEKSGELWELRTHLMTAGVLPEGHPLNDYRKDGFYLPNVKIPQIPTLIPRAEQLAQSMEKLTLYTAEQLEKYLDIPNGTMAAPLAYGQYFIRLHIYPKPDEVIGARVLNGVEAIGGTKVDGVEVVDIIHNGKRHNNILRASPHPDIGLITWLLGSESPGLYIQMKDGSALPFTTDPGKIVANSADFIKYIHRRFQKYESTIHWVGMNEESAKKDRLSIADFVHTRPMFIINNNRTGAEFLYDRLYEINHLDIKTRDNLIAASKNYPKDDEMILRILRWEEKQLIKDKSFEPKLMKYY